MIIIPASDVIQTNYHTSDGMLSNLTSDNVNNDFSNVQLIGYNVNYLADGGVNLASVTHAYPYNLIANTIPEDDQVEVVSSVNTTKGVKPTTYLNYRDKSSALIVVIVYDTNNDQYVNLSDITSLDIQKAKQAAIPVYCYIHDDRPTCSSFYQIGTENTETIAVFYYYSDNTITIDESGTVTISNDNGGFY